MIQTWMASGRQEEIDQIVLGAQRQITIFSNSSFNDMQISPETGPRSLTL